MGSYRVVDNFLNEIQYQVIDHTLNYLDWYWSDVQCETDSPYFYHTFYAVDEVSPKFSTISIFEDKLGVEKWLNVRANLNVNAGTFNQVHRDIYSNTPHLTAIYYHNDNNGGLRLCGDFVESKKNRVVLLDSSTEHQGVHQTDTDRRLVINFNYL